MIRKIRISNNELLDVRICERGKRTGMVTCYFIDGRYADNTFTITSVREHEKEIQFNDYETLIATLNEKRPDWSEFNGKVDHTINTAWYEFKKVRPRTPKVGCWDVYFTNTLTGEKYSTQGDIHKNTTWADFYNWLIGDIEEMDVGEIANIKFDEVCYAGIDEHFYD